LKEVNHEVNQQNKIYRLIAADFEQIQAIPGPQRG
jgi:hypothetical protein